MSNRDKLTGRLILNPHTAYYSGASAEEMRTRAAYLAREIIGGGRFFRID